VFDDHHKTYGLTSLPSWSFLRCIKFIYICKENGPLANPINMGWIRLCTSLWCIKQCLVPRLARPTNRLLSWKHSAPRLKFIGLSGVAPDCPVSLGPMVIFTNDRLPRDCNRVRNVRSQKQSTTVRSHQTVRYATGQVDTQVDYSKPQRLADVAGTRQWTVKCPVRTGLSSVPVDRVGTINTTTIQSIQAFHSPHSIQEQRIHSKTHSKLPNLSKCHN
jgi:hypothetical protein